MKGEYGLEIYANDPAKDGDTYTHICQYFVHFDSPDVQAKAFYQEAPERQMKAQPQATMDQQKYAPGSQMVRIFLISHEKRHKKTRLYYMGLVARKPVFRVSYKARLKPAFSATETS